MTAEGTAGPASRSVVSLGPLVPAGHSLGRKGGSCCCGSTPAPALAPALAGDSEDHSRHPEAAGLEAAGRSSSLLLAGSAWLRVCCGRD